MSDERIELRAVVHFLFLKGLTNRAIYEEVNAVYGQGEQVVALSSVKYWTKAFKEGRTRMADESRPGRPRIPGLGERVKELLAEEQFLSQKKLAKALGVHQTTMHRVLTEDLGLVRVNFKWIPHSLNDTQKRERVELAGNLLDILESSRANWSNIITGDETWVYLENQRDFVWQDPNKERPKKPRTTIGSRKVMITVLWSSSGIQSVSLLQPGQKFDRSFFESVLDKLAEEIAKRRPHLGTEGVMLHIDNARPHLVPGKIRELGLVRLPHPPYSPDLAPSDFFLFGYLKYLLRGKTFASHTELFTEVCQILRDIQPRQYASAYEEWTVRLRNCITNEGNYYSIS